MEAEARKHPGGREHQQVAGDHHDQHRADREGQPLEESSLARFAGEAADREPGDHEPDGRDQEEHHGREGVEIDAQVDWQRGRGLEERLVYGARGDEEASRSPGGDQGGGGEAGDDSPDPERVAIGDSRGHCRDHQHGQGRGGGQDHEGCGEHGCRAPREAGVEDCQVWARKSD